MRKKISAIIITNENISEDDIKISYETTERGFELKILKPLNESYEYVKLFNSFKGFDALITIGDDIDVSPLSDMDISVRKKWCHFDKIDKNKLGDTIISMFKANFSRVDINLKTVSVFVSAFNTETLKLERLYKSLCEQTYNNWNLWILDDSTEDNTNVNDFVKEKEDYRIHMFKNCTHHGNIGFNKHMIAMMCDGDYLLEMDHDDYLMPDCFELLVKAFSATDCDFVYSYPLELINDEPVLYGEKWGFGGYGGIGSFVFNGKEVNFSTTPDINATTIRTIYTQPNHLRCWRKDFYHKIGGHNTTLSVLDDQEILIRTFLEGKMCKIPKVLYIQDEGDTERGEGSGTTAQSQRFNEIQRTTWLIKDIYDRKIHERVLDLGCEDPCWVENENISYLDIEHDQLPPINQILDV